MSFTSASVEEYFDPSEFESVPKIDAHFHYSTNDPAVLRKAESINMHMVTINTELGLSIYNQLKMSKKHKNQYPTIFDFIGTFSTDNFNDDDFSDKAISQIKKCMEAGAKGIKIWKNIGLKLRDKSGKYVTVDHEKFVPIFTYLEKKNIPLLAHLSEPRNCWLPYDEITMASELQYFKICPSYYMYLHPETPSYEQQIAARDRILERYPKLRFIGAHVASLEWNLDEVADRLKRFPEFYVEISARIGHIQLQTMQNKEKVRKFFIDWQDRIIYGSDGMLFDNSILKIIYCIVFRKNWERQKKHPFFYQEWKNQWLFFATKESVPCEKFNMENAPQYIDGLQLPKQVVNKIFYENVSRVMNLKKSYG